LLRVAALTGSAPWLLLAVGLAYAAEQVAGPIDPQKVPWLTWAWVLGLSVAGWFASSAPTLVNWVDGEGINKSRARFAILARIVVSVLAGGTAYFLTVFSGANNLLAFLAVIGASYGGDRYLNALTDRAIGAVQSAPKP
jgi:hypothetical protein